MKVVARPCCPASAQGALVAGAAALDLVGGAALSGGGRCGCWPSLRPCGRRLDGGGASLLRAAPVAPPEIGSPAPSVCSASPHRSGFSASVLQDLAPEVQWRKLGTGESPGRFRIDLDDGGASAPNPHPEGRVEFPSLHLPLPCFSPGENLGFGRPSTALHRRGPPWRRRLGVGVGLGACSSWLVAAAVQCLLGFPAVVEMRCCALLSFSGCCPAALMLCWPVYGIPVL